LTLYSLTNSGYEIGITTYKKSRTNHKAQNPKTQYQMMKLKNN
jgi:hypothetical protein